MPTTHEKTSPLAKEESVLEEATGPVGAGSVLLSYASSGLALLSQKRYEAVRQDRGTDDCRHVEAVLNVQEPLQILSHYLVQVAVRPPRDQQPSYAQVHGPSH